MCDERNFSKMFDLFNIADQKLVLHLLSSICGRM